MPKVLGYFRAVPPARKKVTRVSLHAESAAQLSIGNQKSKIRNA
jgi:hypothetical protein